MDKSNTLNSQDIEKAVEEAVTSVKKFTQKELAKLIASKKPKEFPVLIPVADIGYIVGTNLVKQYNNLWYVASIHNLDREMVFGNKLTAIFYALSDHNRNFQLAGDIARYDLEVSRLLKKIALYKQNTKNKSNAHRLHECEHKLQHKKFLLAKSLKMAKYFYL